MLSICLIKVINLYVRAEFVVNLILMDQEFDKLEGAIENVDGKMGNVEINTTASREHMAEIERSICTDKERVIAISSLLPF